MQFNTSTLTTDIMMFNSRNLGALIVDQEPHVSDWEEPQFGIRNLAIEEKYVFGVLNEGQGIAVAKNVKVTHNQFVEQARAVVSVGSDNADFELLTALRGATPIDVNSAGGNSPAMNGFVRE